MIRNANRWRLELLASVSLLALGVTIPKPGIMPLENMWRIIPDLESFDPETGDYGLQMVML